MATILYNYFYLLNKWRDLLGSLYKEGHFGALHAHMWLDIFYSNSAIFTFIHKYIFFNENFLNQSISISIRHMIIISVLL